MARPGRRTNLALLTLMVIAFVSGLVAFTVGSPGAARIVVVTHGAVGLSILLLVPWKSMIARRGLRRPGTGRKVTSLLLAFLVLVAIGSGVWHAVGGFASALGVSPIQLHVGAALVLLLPFALHTYTHRRPRPVPRRTDFSRRFALQAAVFTAAAAALYVLAPGRPRRETGSHEVGSDDPELMPVTQWLSDPVLALDPSTWRLQIGDPASGSQLDLAALAAMPQDSMRAVLDCTSGWYAEQEWSGVRLDRLLPDAALAGAIDVVSRTGYQRRLPAGEVANLLLATHAGGRPLSAGHGGPARLVAPGRRGFWWVKWVVEIRTVDGPWWLQSPLPLQ